MSRRVAYRRAWKSPAALRLLVVQCLANFGYSGSPILADINGIPAVVGVFTEWCDEDLQDVRTF
jgi:hypothetical protein